MILVVVLLQPRIISNNNIKKSMTVILQPKVASNNILEKDLDDFSVKIQLDDLVKYLQIINIQICN